MLTGLLAGCGGPAKQPGPVQVRDTGLTRLSAAISTFDRARTAVLTRSGDLIAAAVALDEADAACAAGTIGAARTARAKARAALPKAHAALRDLPQRLSAYGTALSRLAAAQKAATSLSADQRAALDEVVRGGRAENDATNAFRVAAVTAWPAYDALSAEQSTWLDRRVAGWYRTPQEAADAYAVMVRDGRPALERARTLLQRVDTARQPVTERERTALATAAAALAVLRTPG